MSLSLLPIVFEPSGPLLIIFHLRCWKDIASWERKWGDLVARCHLIRELMHMNLNIFEMKVPRKRNPMK